ncbi:group II intron maturase-specific domain-containing protein [Rhizobium gallicum]|uniref:group II intron maturase-specific domain-containing protein n=1 Tax=Rhizobium gallicum TaxID=56730 RepID=UPI001AD7EDDF|nr:group II intron maturase-specific domain-containing protein [Rhizobium gallicum]
MARRVATAARRPEDQEHENLGQGTAEEPGKNVTKKAELNHSILTAAWFRFDLPGWKSYFQLAQTPQIFKNLDSWIRHRLRAIQLKQWGKGTTVYSRLRSLGAHHEWAALIAGGRDIGGGTAKLG